MTPHPVDVHADPGLLHDLVDDRLAPAARAAVEAHVAGCAACAEQLVRLRALLGAAAALPRERSTTVDGWPALRARLADRAAPTALPRSTIRTWRPAVWARPALAAAAAVLFAVAGWSALRDGDAAGDATAVAVESPALTDAASFATVERDYARATAELTARLDATRDRLSPAVAASVDRSLATIDGALAESQAALRADPGNLEIARFVAASYEHKLELLRRSTAITSGD